MTTSAMDAFGNCLAIGAIISGLVIVVLVILEQLPLKVAIELSGICISMRLKP